MRFCQNLIGLVLIIQYLDVSPKNGQVTYCRVGYSVEKAFTTFSPVHWRMMHTPLGLLSSRFHFSKKPS